MLKKKGKSFGKTVIVVTSILVLSMTGVSYAYWSDSLTINTTIKVGSMKPVFCGDETRTIELFNNNGNNKVKIGELIITPNGNTLDIYGKILKGININQEHIGFCIRNSGTVPIRLDKEVSDDDNGNDKKIEAASDHLSASVTLKNSYIDVDETYSPNEGSDGNPKIKFDFDASGLTEEKSESENITLTIPFTQWIVGEAGNDGHYGSWEKSLIINITINVVDSLVNQLNVLIPNSLGKSIEPEASESTEFASGAEGSASTGNPSESTEFASGTEGSASTGNPSESTEFASGAEGSASAGNPSESTEFASGTEGSANTGNPSESTEFASGTEGSASAGNPSESTEFASGTEGSAITSDLGGPLK